jgi:hypothetical protein
MNNEMKKLAKKLKVPVGYLWSVLLKDAHLNIKIHKNHLIHEKDQIKFVKLSWENTKYIKNPSEKVQLEAVKEDARAIYYIENPTYKVRLEAVKEDDLGYIKNK